MGGLKRSQPQMSTTLNTLVFEVYLQKFILPRGSPRTEHSLITPRSGGETWEGGKGPRSSRTLQPDNRQILKPGMLLWSSPPACAWLMVGERGPAGLPHL